ncbi:glycosyltransferase [bacterium]|nr:glycosyltransferase [candidate division CSSED10-310 bacterium]
MNLQISDSPSISIIIPCRDSTDSLEQTLSSIDNLTTKPLETLVIDDGSKKPFRELAESYGAAYYRLDPGRGPAYARNYGADRASGDVVWFVDSDVTISPDSIDRLATVFSRDPDIAAVQGVYDPLSPENGIVTRYQNYYYHFSFSGPGTSDTAICATFCFAIRRSIFKESGGFDIRIAKPTVEDEIFGYWLAGSGHSILLNPCLQVRHQARYTLRSFLTRKFRMAFNQIKSLLRGTRPPVFVSKRNRTHHSRPVLGGIFLAPFLIPSWIIGWLPGFTVAAVYTLCNIPFWSYLTRREPIRLIPAFILLTWIDQLTIFTALAAGGIDYVRGNRF